MLSYEHGHESDHERALPGDGWALERAGHDVSDEPRDPDGKWTDGGGGGDGGSSTGGGKHPGAGYSKNAYVDSHGVIHTSNVYDAQRALFEDRKVELKQPKQISTLITRLGETAKEMAEQGEEAPVFNLCNVSIKGTNLFCAEQIGIPRAEMPVIPAKQTKDFVRYLKKQGYKVEKDDEYAANLRATQSEISGVKVADSMKRIEKEGFYKRLIISRDDYILDGHHTWAGALGIDAQDNNLHDDKSFPVFRVDISITKLIAEAEKWTGGKGKKPASEKPKAFVQMTLAQAARELEPALFRKYYVRAQEFFAANAHLARNINDVVIVVRGDYIQDPATGLMDGSHPGPGHGEGGGGGSSAEAKPGEDSAKLDPKVISVGGDQWNQATARKLEREYQKARPKVDKLANDAVGKQTAGVNTPSDWKVVPHPSGEGFALQNALGEYALNPSGAGEAKFESEAEAQSAIEQYAPTQSVYEEEEEPAEEPFVPEEWDMLSGNGQSEVEEKFYSDNEQSYLDSEIENYWDEQGPVDARRKAAEDFNEGNEQDWAKEALDAMREKRQESGKKDIPFDNDTLIEAITIDAPEDSYKWQEKTKIDIDDAVLNESKATEGQEGLPGIEPPDYSKLLTEEMRDDIKSWLTDKLDDEADSLISTGKIEAPDYLGESAKEFMEQIWSEMDDKQKFEYAKSNTDVVENETTGMEKPAKAGSEPPAGTYTGTIDALPKTFDPLNEDQKGSADYRRTQALAKYLSVERTVQVMNERGIKPEQIGTSVGSDEWSRSLKARIASVDSRLWSSWKSSSTTQNGILLQVATAEELGGRLNTKTGAGGGEVRIDPASTRNWANEQFEEIGGYAGVKAYIRAKWETTQYLLDKAGQQELELYRGIDLKKYDPARYAQAVKEKGIKPQDEKQLVVGSRGDAKVNFEKAPTIKVDRNGAASATTDIKVANGWKSGVEGAVVLRAHVPRTAAISVPAYGINVHGEREVVVAGTAWKAWDAWLGKAPPFDVVPIGADGTGIGTSAPKLAA